MNEVKLIANRYAIGSLIGQGGMGAVYQGVDTRTNQPVAIKLLMQELITNIGDEAVERFRREVEALRRVEHPNIIKLLATAREGNQYYIVMEFAGGGSLANMIRKHGALPVDRTLAIALDLADALTRAHRLNIVHRDLKPDNVLLTKDGTPRLTDFGVARIGDRTRLTQSGYVVGTGCYLSPEACRGQELDARADIWAFGIMLYEMLTGKLPYAGTNPAAIITAILMEPVPDIRLLRSDVPPALAELIGAMLTKNRDERITSIRLVGAHIEAIISGNPLPLAAATAPELNLDIAAALEGLAAKWQQQAQEANAAGGRIRMGNPGQAQIYRSMAESLTSAADELRALLAQTTSGQVEITDGSSEPEELFVAVSRHKLEKVLERAGLRFTNIYEDKGHVFSVIFPKMPPMQMNLRIERLTSAANGNIIILDNGRLNDSQEPYIDFGFTVQPL
jgi:hypothetical protein